MFMLAIWSMFGAIFFLFMFGKVKLPTQKVILLVMGGPLVWIFAPAIKLLDFISEKAFEPMYNWLTKE